MGLIWMYLFYTSMIENPVIDQCKIYNISHDVLCHNTESQVFKNTDSFSKATRK